MENLYLIDDPGREATALRHLTRLSVLATELMSALGVHPEFCWYALNIDTTKLCKSVVGDIDLLAGPLHFKDPSQFKKLVKASQRELPKAHPTVHEKRAAFVLVQRGELKWPPILQHVAAVEAKCAYLPREAMTVDPTQLKSVKASSQKVRRMNIEIKRLVSMGINRVALLDIIASPPADGHNGQAWLSGASVARQAMAAMEGALAGRLPNDSSAGQFVWARGAVSGKSEQFAGSGSPIMLRVPQDNPFIENKEVLANRQEMLNNLKSLLEKVPAPRTFPYTIEDCRICKILHPMKDERC